MLPAVSPPQSRPSVGYIQWPERSADYIEHSFLAWGIQVQGRVQSREILSVSYSDQCHTHTQVGDSYRWSPQVYDSCFIHSLHVNRMFYREIERVGVVEVANHLIREPRETHVFSRASWAEKLSNSGCVVSCADALRFLRIFACRVESHVSR